MRRKKKESGGSLDSLLDTITTVVGILIILLIVVQLGADSAVKRIVEEKKEEDSKVKAREFSVEKALEFFGKAGFTKRGGDGILINDSGDKLSVELLTGYRHFEDVLVVLKEQACSLSTTKTSSKCLYPVSNSTDSLSPESLIKIPSPPLLVKPALPKNSKAFSTENSRAFTLESSSFFSSTIRFTAESAPSCTTIRRIIRIPTTVVIVSSRESKLPPDSFFFLLMIQEKGTGQFLLLHRAEVARNDNPNCYRPEPCDSTH